MSASSDDRVGGCSSRLDTRTQLVGGWDHPRSGHLYPTAGEASLALVPRQRCESSGGRNHPPDVEANRARAASRARSRVRRYCVANKVRFMWTLTFNGAQIDRPSNRAVAVAAGVAFVRRLREAGVFKTGQSVPYVLVAEPHKDGHWHLHFGVAQYVPKARMERIWGHGFVGAPKGRPRAIGLAGVRVRRGGHAQERAMAGYLAKYVGKDFKDETAGAHRYEVGQGCQPESVAFAAQTEVEWLAQAIDLMGGAPSSVWRSDFESRGPPSMTAVWDDF